MPRLMLAAPLVAALAVAAAVAAASASAEDGVGAPPPELTTYASQWPAHNLNLANTRSTTSSPIDSTNVARLRPKWRFKLKGAGAFGAFASTPIALGQTVYLRI
jgi:hypothetical protein